MIALLLDHLWQSTLFAAAAGGLTLAFAANSARLRFWLWFAASLKFLMPFSVLTALGGALFQTFSPRVAPQIFLGLESAAKPFSGATRDFVPPVPGIDWTTLFLTLWAAGFMAVMAIWLGRWLKLRAVFASASPLTLEAPMPVKSSTARIEPGLVGIWRPVLLLPSGIETVLSPSEMQTILAHEECHLGRRDNLLAAIHMVVEALFWFHPLVWWLGVRLIAERENACDESVLAAGSDPQTYADGILKVCRFYLHSSLACAAGVSGADLRKRIKSIMKNDRVIRIGVAKKCLLGVCAVATLAVPLGLGFLTTPAAMALATNAPHPGTEAALRRQIEGWEKKQPDFDGLTPGYARVIERQRALVQKMIVDWGSLKSIIFKENDPNQGDAYLVAFEHGLSVWMVQPLSGGKIASLTFGPAIARADNGPSPGAAVVARRNYQALLSGAPAYELMTPAWATATMRQRIGLIQDAKSLGALKSLTFTRIAPRGWDIYAATFDNGTASWMVAPLVDGKLNGMSWSDLHEPGAPARPGTETSLRRYIASLEKGQPNYDEMVPAMANIVRRQLPDVLAIIKPWGALKSIAFKGRGAGDWDIYNAIFEHGKAEWVIGQLTADGKVQRRAFRPLP